MNRYWIGYSVMALGLIAICIEHVSYKRRIDTISAEISAIYADSISASAQINTLSHQGHQIEGVIASRIDASDRAFTNFSRRIEAAQVYASDIEASTLGQTSTEVYCLDQKEQGFVVSGTETFLVHCSATAGQPLLLVVEGTLRERPTSPITITLDCPSCMTPLTSQEVAARPINPFVFAFKLALTPRNNVIGTLTLRCNDCAGFLRTKFEREVQ